MIKYRYQTKQKKMNKEIILLGNFFHLYYGDFVEMLAYMHSMHFTTGH